MAKWSLASRAFVAAIAVAGLTAGNTGALALAQDAPASGNVLQALEEVTVTAQRREESEQSIPMAITALSAAALERQQIRSIAQLNDVVPNFAITQNTGTSSSAKIYMRGIGESESFFTADTPVGIYVDDVYIARQTGALFDLFDIERLEVLRGPQGTLYGRNTSAGAVKLISKKPTLRETLGQAELTVGSYNRLDVRATGNLPIGDSTALQGAILMRTRDGYTRNLFDGKDVNDQDIKGLRLSLLTEPTDRFRALLTADYVRERSTPGYPAPIQLNASRDVPSDPVPKSGSWWETNSDIVDPMNDLDQWGISATLEFEATDALTLKSITSYRKLDNLLYLDADGDIYAPAPSIVSSYNVFQDQSQYQVSEELQALGTLMDQRLKYVAGLYFFREFNEQDSKSVIGVPALFGLPSASAGRIDLTNIAREELTTDSYAAFASGTFDITDRLSLTAGLRYTRESKDFANQVILPNGTQQVVCLNTTTVTPMQAAAAPCTPAQIALGYFDFTNQSTFDKTWTDWTPRLVVDYQLTDAAMVYLSAAKGFKGGTTSGRDVAALRNFSRIVGDPEINWSYEVGLKADWLDRRLRSNIAAFHNEYEGLQLSLATSGGGFGRINAGDVEFEGAELELVAVPIEGLELRGALSLLDAKYTSWSGALTTCADQGLTTVEQYLDLPIKESPKWGYRIGANYSYDLGARGVVSAGADYTAKDDSFNNVCGTAGISRQGNEFLSAQLRWEDSAGKLLVALAGTNLTDSEVVAAAFDFGRSLGFASIYPYAPRMWSLSARYRFN